MSLSSSFLLVGGSVAESVAVGVLAVSRFDNATEWLTHDVLNYSFSNSLVDVLALSVLRIFILLLSSCCCVYRSRISASQIAGIVSVVVVGLGAIIVAGTKLAIAPSLRYSTNAAAALGVEIGVAVIATLVSVFSAFQQTRVSPANATDAGQEDDNQYLRLSGGDDDDDDDAQRDPEASKGTTSSSLYRICMLAWPERWLLTVATVALFIAAILQMIMPALIGTLFEQLASPTITPEERKEALQNVVFEMLIVSGISNVAVFVRAYLFTLSGERVVARFRTRLFDKVMHQDIAFFDEEKGGELQSRLTADAAMIQNAATVNISMGLSWMTQAAVGIAVLFVISWELATVMMCVVPVLIVMASVYGRFVSGVSKAYQASLAEAGHVAEQAFMGVRTVRSFANEKYEVDRYAGRVRKSYLQGKRRAFAYASFVSMFGLLAYLAICLVLWYGSTQADVSSGHLASFMLYTLFVAGSLGGLAGLYSTLMSAVGASDRMFELIDKQPGINNRSGGGSHRGEETTNAVPAAAVVVEGALSFENVTFSYPSRPTALVLDDLSFRCEPGQITALVGPSGGGKSTCIALLEHFYDPTSGNVSIDGVPLRAVDPFWLHTNVALVSQDVVLFAATIEENIRYGLNVRGGLSRDGSRVTRAQVEEAARLANAHDFISSFPDGYETKVGERGQTLSGGQKQRVAIARAILLDPKVLLLDEATSALDAESEHLVQEALDRIMQDRTTMVIAHRLSTVKHAHNIVVIENGTVVEQGNHEVLLADKDGVYAALVNRQLGKKKKKTTQE